MSVELTVTVELINRSHCRITLIVSFSHQISSLHIEKSDGIKQVSFMTRVILEWFSPSLSTNGELNVHNLLGARKNSLRSRGLIAEGHESTL